MFTHLINIITANRYIVKSQNCPNHKKTQNFVIKITKFVKIP